MKAGGQLRTALNAGYHLAFFAGAVSAAAAAIIGAIFLQPKPAAD